MKYFNYILLFAFCLSTPVQLKAQKKPSKVRQSLSVDAFPFLYNGYWDKSDRPKNWSFMYTRDNTTQSSFFNGSFRYGLLAYVKKKYDHEYSPNYDPPKYQSKMDYRYGRVGFFLGHQWDFPLYKDKLFLSGVLDVGYLFSYTYRLNVNAVQMPGGYLRDEIIYREHVFFLAPQLLLRYDISKYFSCALGLSMTLMFNGIGEEWSCEFIDIEGHFTTVGPSKYRHREFGSRFQPVLNFYYRF